MTTNEFITLLENNADFPLLFEYEQGSYARADFHITELKNVHFDTVDCGGIRNEWQEVHLQIWESKRPQPTHRVDTNKALKIIQVVDRVRESWGEVELKVEYGNRHFHTAVLPINRIDILEDQLVVRLGKEYTTCKAIDRATSLEAAAMACCGPATKEIETIAEPATSMKELAVADAGDCCTPGGGCC